MNDTFAKVVDIIAAQLDKSKESITQESSLEEMGADSLDRVEIVMKLEEVFNVQLDDDMADKISTVGQLASYVESLLKK